MNTIEQIRRILHEVRTIAVVGLSAEWHRPSFFAAKYMQDHGYRIVPVNPRYANASTDVLGEHCYAALTDIPFPVDMVDVFRRTEDVLPIAQQAIQIGAKCLWQQIGVMNLEADALARLEARAKEKWVQPTAIVEKKATPAGAAPSSAPSSGPSS